MHKAFGIVRHINAAVVISVSVYFVLFPGLVVVWDLTDSNIRSAGIPQRAWKIHRALTPKLENWAQQRLASTRASELSINNISGTEWPLFGSVFYLWATEALQDEWKKNSNAVTTAPAIYAQRAIDVVTRLVIDPKQANWVKIHWGENYLKKENVFYRMLVISALTSHVRLTGETRYLPFLKEQTDSLALELDTCETGLLDDYPGQCYPGDIVTAIAMIQKADRVLGSDHSEFVNRAIRGFQNAALDSRGLVPYAADARSGVALGTSRGCGNSYISLFSPEIWPIQAAKWYDLYSRYFWQRGWTAVGFREFPNDVPENDWYFDVDAGPVVKGLGFAACAFGVGAARVNGHFEHAYPLTAEMLATSWPLPNGTLLGPRLLSNATDAPYLGETAILFCLTRLPAPGFASKTGGSLPGFVYIVLLFQFGVGFLLVGVSTRSVIRWWRLGDSQIISLPKAQLGFWLGFTLTTMLFFICGKVFFALVLIGVASIFPKCKRKVVSNADSPIHETQMRR